MNTTASLIDLIKVRMDNINNTPFFNQIASEIKPFGYTLETCYAFNERDTTYLKFSTGDNNKYFDIDAFTIDRNGSVSFVISQSHYSYMNMVDDSIVGAEHRNAMKNAISAVELLESKDWRECPILDKSTLNVSDEITEISSMFFCSESKQYEDSINQLKTINLPSSIKYIHNYAFANCPELEEISLDVETYYHSFAESYGGLTKASFYHTFADCPKLKTIRIKGSRIDVYQSVFAKTTVGDLDYWNEHNITFICDDGETSYDEYVEYEEKRQDKEFREERTREPMRVLQRYLEGNSIYYMDDSKRVVVKEGHLFNWNLFWRWGKEEYFVSSEPVVLSENEKARVQNLIDIMDYYLNGGDIEECYREGEKGWTKVESKYLYWDIEHYDYRKC